MNYTKIVSKDKKWQHIITEDLNIDEKNPACTLARRFKVFSLKVLSQNNTNERIVAYIIKGEVIEGQCLLFLKVDLNYDMVVEFSIKRNLSFDKQLAHFLSLAFLKRLQKKEIYNISSDVFDNVAFVD